MTDVKQVSEADAERILAVNAHVLLPVLRQRQASCLNRLLGAYKNNGELLPIVAEYSAHTDLVRELELKLMKYNKGV